MTDENILDADVELFRKLFRPAPAEAAGLDELADGFTESRARRILGDPELLAHFKTLAAHVEPGDGWMSQASGEAAPASRELLGVALTERSGDLIPVIITRDDDGVLLTPEPIADMKADQLAAVELPGGFVAWPPQDLGLAPLVRFSGPGIPGWVEFVAGARAVEDLRANRPRTGWDSLVVGPHPLSRYALGCWLERHRPTDIPEDVLRAELGALAFEFAGLLGGTDAARCWLFPLGATLVRLHDEIRKLGEREEALARAGVASATEAYLATCGDAPEAADVARTKAGETLPSPPVREEFALAAGDLLDEEEPAIPEEFLHQVAERRRLANSFTPVPGDEHDPERPFLAELLAAGPRHREP